MIISGSVYSCTNEVGNTYTEDQAAFVAASCFLVSVSD